jgi:soluble lytic murein transglycosylase-like protein
MRTRLVSALAICALVLVAAPARASNPQIAGLQVALRAWGLYLGPIDGISGPVTVAAVKSFQQHEGLPVTGLAGPRTRTALGPLGGPLLGARPLRRGSFGWDVSVLQFELARQGLYPGALDGYFDAATEAALRRYQLTMRLARDGVAGPATFAAFGLQRDVPIATLAARTGYRVRSGDSLTAIAKRHDTTVAALARLNGLNPARVLAEGVVLKLPALAPRARAAAPADLVREAIDRWARHYGIDPHLARALAWMESGYQTGVRSSVGATGVLQLLPETRDYVETVLLGRRLPRTADGDIEGGLAYLHHLLDEFAGDTSSALGAWYQGARAMREHGPFGETRLFVANVLALSQRM